MSGAISHEPEDEDISAEEAREEAATVSGGRRYLTAEEIMEIGARRQSGARCSEDDRPFRDADARGADLSDIDWRGEDFTRCDLRGADLSGASFAGASFRDADLWNANFRDSDLSEALHLLPVQFAATDLTRARLPADVPRFEALDTVQNLSENSAKVFVTMVLAVVYTFLTMATTKDLQLITNSNTTKLPVIGAEISIVSFFIITPIVLLAFFIYFHLFLLRLWEAVAELPAIFPNGRRLHAKIYPWLMNDLARHRVPRLWVIPAPLSVVQTVLSIFLGYWLVPLTLVAIWCQFIRVQNKVVSAEHVVLIAISVGASVYFARLFENALSAREGRVPWYRRVAICAGCWRGFPAGLLTLLFFGIATYGVLTAPLIPDYTTLQGRIDALRRQSGTPPRWLHAQAFWDYLRPAKDLPGNWAQRWIPHLLQLVRIPPFSSIPEAHLSKRPADWTNVQAPDNSELSRVAGGNFRLFSFQHLRAPRSFLAKGEFIFTDLRGARFDDAELRGARIEAAHASYADFSRAIFVEQLDASKITPAESSTKMHAARLESVNFAGALFVEALMNRMEIRYCNFERANFSGARCWGTRFNDCMLTSANFTSATCNEAEFYFAFKIGDARRLPTSTMDGAIFHQAVVERSVFTNATLEGANFSGANLAGAHFADSALDRADFTGADLREANLSTATGLTAHQLRQAKSLFKAELPAALQSELAAEVARPLQATALDQPGHKDR